MNFMQFFYFNLNFFSLFFVIASRCTLDIKLYPSEDEQVEILILCFVRFDCRV